MALSGRLLGLFHGRQVRRSRELDSHVEGVPEPDEADGEEQSGNLVVVELRSDASPGFIIDSAPIADPDHLFNERKSCSLS